MMQKGKYRLRAMEPEDVAPMFVWENDADEWWKGAQLGPISREALRRFTTGNHDIWADGQLRMMLVFDGVTIGAVDVYGIDARNLRAGVGIIVDANARRAGHAKAGLYLISEWAFEHLGLRSLFAEIPGSHRPSLDLFLGAGFSECGRYRDWLRKDGGWDDVILVQRMNTAPTTNEALAPK
jgi:diamine N-acetyltransferase